MSWEVQSQKGIQPNKVIDLVKPQTLILGNVIPVVYAKLISRKGTVYNTT